MLLGGRHSPSTALLDAFLLADFSAHQIADLSLADRPAATWRQVAVVLGDFLVLVGGREKRDSVSRTVAAINLRNGQVLKTELDCGLHSASYCRASIHFICFINTGLM